MHDLETVLFVLASCFVVTVGFFIRTWIHGRRERRFLDKSERAAARGIAVPPTLHPVFDPTRCIGSGTCTRVCPQGDDVIGLLHGRGALIDPSMCIGHGRCAAECPVGAIRLVFGSSERGVDIPHLKPTFETNVPGLYITGELGGMGLVANSVRQAAEGMQNIRAALGLRAPSRDSGDGVVDVAIIGAGPAGLTSALFAVQHGMSYRLFDKEAEVGGSILHYPRRKVVVTRQVAMPLLGTVHTGTVTKEQLLALWKKAVADHGVRLETGALVDRISREEDGTFSVATSKGLLTRSRAVMLAIGRRGTPRKLGVPGEESDKVFYSMLEPETYAGQRVLVVGGGESAIETACALAEGTDAEVTVAHRGEALRSNNDANQTRLDSAVRSGRIELLGRSAVLEIRETSVQLEIDGARREIPNDDVVVQIGGELPVSLLESAGVSLERHFGEEKDDNRKNDTLEVFERIRAQTRGSGVVDFYAGNRRAQITTAMLAIAIAAFLLTVAFFGRSHYVAPTGERASEAVAPLFAPTGIFGHTLGVAGLVLMLFNLMYFARKELKFMRGAGQIRTWISLHMLTGLSVGAIALLHTSLLLKNPFAAALYTSLGVVVLSGIIGRYVYTFIPVDPRGRPLIHEALVSLSDRLRREFDRLFADLEITAEVDKVLDRSFRPNSPGLVIIARLLGFWPVRYAMLHGLIRRARASLKRERAKEFVIYARQMFLLRFQMEVFPGLRRLFGPWRVFHGLFALLLVFLVAAHVAVEFWVGFRWLF